MAIAKKKAGTKKKKPPIAAKKVIAAKKKTAPKPARKGKAAVKKAAVKKVTRRAVPKFEKVVASIKAEPSKPVIKDISYDPKVLEPKWQARWDKGQAVPVSDR